MAEGPGRCCLDVVKISWGAGTDLHRSCGTLLEISPCGGVVHIDEPVSVGSDVTIWIDATEHFDGEVQRVEHDEFGYYASVALKQPWFPDTYQPRYIARKSA